MSIVVVGLNHRTAPVDLREQLAFGRSEVPAALAELVAPGLAAEAVLLSTCNRTEFYLALEDTAAGEAAGRALLAGRAGLAPAEMGRHLYVHRDRAAVEHLFRVTAGVDSMILGEPQIQGQVKEAYQLALATRSSAGPVVGTVLNRLFQSALRAGGRVRSETELGLGAASVSSAAVELAKKIFGSLQGRNALVVGAGEMSEITVDCLKREGVRRCLVANRTEARAKELAERVGGQPIEWDGIGAALARVDIVVCSTAAPRPVLRGEQVRAALPGGARRPLCIVDIAIPRDVEPEVGREPNVFLYNIDDLQSIVDTNLGRRRDELPRAEALIAEGLDEFWSWYASLAVVPTIRALRDHGEALRQEELEKALRRLAHLAPEDRAAVEALTRALLNKLLHAPTVRLREAAGNGRGTAVLDLVRYLYELDHGAPAEDAPPREPL
ncbi:MAG TPA: glutamyl-tRNA reductase [Longimicrobiaceae bacterium]|nr:glutamyl-tRNA reductase [Longimicrobiaceae bacterium]